jgi:hypothetical protein
MSTDDVSRLTGISDVKGCLTKRSAVGVVRGGKASSSTPGPRSSRCRTAAHADRGSGPEARAHTLRGDGIIASSVIEPGREIELAALPEAVLPMIGFTPHTTFLNEWVG